METTFTEGQTVRSRVNAQGMTRGQLLRVAAVSVRSTFAGSFTTLTLATEQGKSLQVGNPHLVVEVVS